MAFLYLLPAHGCRPGDSVTWTPLGATIELIHRSVIGAAPPAGVKFDPLPYAPDLSARMEASGETHLLHLGHPGCDSPTTAVSSFALILTIRVPADTPNGVTVRHFWLTHAGRASAVALFDLDGTERRDLSFLADLPQSLVVASA